MQFSSLIIPEEWIEIFEETLTKKDSSNMTKIIWIYIDKCKKKVSLVHIIFDLSGVKNEETVSETVSELQLFTNKGSS